MLESGFDGLIIDIDGTLLVHDRAIPGAAELLARCDRRGVRYRLVTNTTRRSRASTAGALRRAGIEVPDELVLQPAVLARRVILDSARPRAALLVPDDLRVDLAGVEEDSRAPDWVVIGDIGRRFDFDTLNAAFRRLRAEARLLALHKNPCWHASAEEGWVLDAGAFVAALEYAAGVEAEVVGKPSPEFFRLALRDLGLDASRVLVVGDDVGSDGRGGASAGCRRCSSPACTIPVRRLSPADMFNGMRRGSTLNGFTADVARHRPGRAEGQPREAGKAAAEGERQALQGLPARQREEEVADLGECRAPAACRRAGRRRGQRRRQRGSRR